MMVMSFVSVPSIRSLVSLTKVHKIKTKPKPKPETRTASSSPLAQRNDSTSAAAAAVMGLAVTASEGAALF